MSTAHLASDAARLTSPPPAALSWRGLDPLPAQGLSPTPAAAIALAYRGGHAVSQRQKSWSGMIANIAEMRCDGDLHVDLDADAARLSVVLEEAGGRFEVHAKSRRGHHPTAGSPQPLSMITAGLDVHGRADKMRFMRHLLLQFDVPALARMAEDDMDLSDAFTPRLMFDDPSIMRLAQLLAEECASDAPHSRLYGDKLSLALLLALLRSNAPGSQSIRTGRLAPWQLRCVTEYLMANLSEDIELQTLANLIKLSRSYFSRAFKASAGLAPHQWLMQARIAKAKELLLACDLPLAQIAVDVGFADQAHFTRTFGRAAGQSPGAWQRARRC